MLLMLVLMYNPHMCLLIYIPLIILSVHEHRCMIMRVVLVVVCNNNNHVHVYPPKNTVYVYVR